MSNKVKKYAVFTASLEQINNGNSDMISDIFDNWYEVMDCCKKIIKSKGWPFEWITHNGVPVFLSPDKNRIVFPYILEDKEILN